MTPEAKRKRIRGRYRKFVKNGLWRYNGRYDAYFNTKTREWVEDKCSDKECEFCANRPDLAPTRATSTRTKETR